MNEDVMMDEDEKQAKSDELEENPQLNLYRRELEKDVEINLANIREKSMLVSSIRAKWLGHYAKEKENLDRIKRMRAKLMAQKTATAGPQSVLKLKSDAVLSENDERVKRLDTLRRVTEANVDFIEHVFNILDGFGFQIKNTIELLKLERS